MDHGAVDPRRCIGGCIAPGICAQGHRETPVAAGSVASVLVEPVARVERVLSELVRPQGFEP